MKERENVVDKTTSQKTSLPTMSIGDIVRVADKYYQLIETPEKEITWALRDKGELKQDGINLMAVKRFHGWTVKHSITNYQYTIGEWLNLSMPLQRHPKEGDFPTIKKLFTHIFGEQVELGYDRYTLLVKQPEQLQPILVLCSKEQGTGKTTLLNFDKALFGQNAVILNVSQYEQQFNGIFASKLVIGIDETVISKTFIKERLKQDSTAAEIQLRKMHTEHKSLPFFGKYTLCTNKETDFIQLEEEDMRFWIRKVEKIEGEFDETFFDKLVQEIPAFLYFLLHREMHVPKPLSRQWFSKEQIHTDALDRVLEESKSTIYEDIKAFTEEQIYSSEKDLYITVSELKGALNGKYNAKEITKCLRQEWKKEPPKQQRYTPYYGSESKNGRPYLFAAKGVLQDT